MKTSEVNEIVQAQVLEALDAGVVPWHMPWANGLPMSMSTNKPYRGINNLILGLTAMKKHYSSQWWGTFGQIAKLSGFTEVPRKNGKGTWWAPPADDPDRRILKEDQNSTVIYLWKVSKRANPDDPDDPIVYLYARTFRVFNAEQAAASLPEKYYSTERVPVKDMPGVEAVWDRYISEGGPRVIYGGSSAHYEMDNDLIVLPPRDTYESTEAMWGVHFHEAGHSTGHKSRLKREGVDNFDHFGSQKYSREELIAELTSLTVRAMLGIEVKSTFDNSVGYIDHWRSKIRGEDGKSLVATAARKAQNAVDHIFGITYDNDGES